MHSHTVCISYQKVNKQTNKPEKGCLKERASEAAWTKDHCHMLSLAKSEPSPLFPRSYRCRHCHFTSVSTSADYDDRRGSRPETGVYDFRDFFPEGVRAHKSPQAVQSQGHCLAHPQDRIWVTSPHPLNLVGVRTSHFLNFPLDLTLGLDPSYSQKWFHSFHEKYRTVLT